MPTPTISTPTIPQFSCPNNPNFYSDSNNIDDSNPNFYPDSNNTNYSNPKFNINTKNVV